MELGSLADVEDEVLIEYYAKLRHLVDGTGDGSDFSSSAGSAHLPRATA